MSIFEAIKKLISDITHGLTLVKKRSEILCLPFSTSKIREFKLNAAGPSHTQETGDSALCVSMDNKTPDIRYVFLFAMAADVTLIWHRENALSSTSFNNGIHGATCIAYVSIS